ncbi:MAG: DUF192 domain-containing protein, partial [Candidatus Nanohaloarchaea archaeon]
MKKPVSKHDKEKYAYFISNNKTLGKITLEIADTREERKKGLMFRKSLKNNHGMLFIFNKSANRTFWMKNTYIPLNIIFINENLTIVKIVNAEPQPNVSEQNL